MGERKKILLIATGGTIAMHRGARGYEPYKSADSLLDGVPEIRAMCDVDVVSIAQIDSADMHPQMWLDISEAVEANYHAYDGFVITHGTDTMAYTASALSFFLQELGKPIVLTGAQIPMDVIGSDARDNLVNAFRVATSTIAEVVVVFGTKIIKGVRARKISAFSLEAFESINTQPFGEIGLSIRYHQPYKKASSVRVLFVQKSLDPEVALIMVHPGIKESLIRKAVDEYHGIVLLGYGAGTIPTSGPGSILPALQYADEQGVPVVLGTQSLRGIATPELYSVGHQALEAGVIPMVDMTPEAALVKLMWVLGQTRDKKTITSMMLKSYVGEITPELAEELLRSVPSGTNGGDR